MPPPGAHLTVNIDGFDDEGRGRAVVDIDGVDFDLAVRGAFPGARDTPFLIPRATARLLEPVDPLAEARYLFTSLLRNALGDDNMHALTLSWPATRAGKPVARSPMLEDLLDLLKVIASRVGQDQPALPSMEQCRAQVVLQLGDLVAYGRGRDAEIIGGIPDGAQPGRGLEAFQGF